MNLRSYIASNNLFCNLNSEGLNCASVLHLILCKRWNFWWKFSPSIDQVSSHRRHQIFGPAAVALKFSRAAPLCDSAERATADRRTSRTDREQNLSDSMMTTICYERRWQLLMFSLLFACNHCKRRRIIVVDWRIDSSYYFFSFCFFLSKFYFYSVLPWK